MSTIARNGKKWRDGIEGELTKRGLEFEHIVLVGEEELEEPEETAEEKDE